jgi:hypothetical protein
MSFPRVADDLTEGFFRESVDVHAFSRTKPAKAGSVQPSPDGAALFELMMGKPTLTFGSTSRIIVRSKQKTSESADLELHSLLYRPRCVCPSSAIATRAPSALKLLRRDSADLL